MYVMLDFICTCFAELWGTGREQNMQNETLCIKRDSNPTLEKLMKGKPVPLDHLSNITYILTLILTYEHSDIHSHIWTFWHTFSHIHSHIWIFWHTYILTYKYYDIRRALWIFIHIIVHSDHRTTDPKGHISCTCQWVQCATFIDRSDRTAILSFQSARLRSNNMIYENIKYFQKFVKKC